MNKEEFIKEVKKLGLDVTSDILNQLDIYANFLIEYNTHTNLTAITNLAEIYLKHFYDSLTITKVVDLSQENSLLDIGSGAGFPGMILKMFFPNLHVVLVDSNNKKTKFLMELKEKLGFSNLEIINARIEKVAKEKLNSFDVVTARAVTNMAVLTELAMPLVSVGKYFIAMKGSNQEEIEEGKFAILKMNGIIEYIESFELYKDCGKRNIIKVRKEKVTNISDLRPYDKIIKKPLIK